MQSTTNAPIPDKGDQHISTHTQYGVIFPDGTTAWSLVDVQATGSSAIHIIDLVPSPDGNRVSQFSKENWTRHLTTRAEKAKLDVDQYRDMHRFVQRTVILSVTAAKAVQL